MILTKEEAAAVHYTGTVIKGFIDMDIGHRNVTVYEDGAVVVFDAQTGDTEHFDDKVEFALRYEVVLC